MEIGANLKIEKLTNELDSLRENFLDGKDKELFKTAQGKIKENPKDTVSQKEIEKIRDIADKEIERRGSEDLKAQLERINDYKAMANPGIGVYHDIYDSRFKEKMQAEVEATIKHYESELAKADTPAKKRNLEAAIANLKREGLIGINPKIAYQFDVSKWNGKVKYTNSSIEQKYHTFGMADSNKVYTMAFNNVLKKYPGAEILINDLSMPGGGSSFHHASNTAGRVMDIALFNNEMGSASHYKNDPRYDREATIEFMMELINAGKMQGKQVYFYFNDPDVMDFINKKVGYECVSEVEGHSNHLHAIIGE